MAKTQAEAELLQAATGRPDVFDIVQDVDGELVVLPTRPGAPPIPEFAARAVDSVGEDEEIVRLAIVFSDLLYGVKMPSMTMTAAELRERADRKLQTRCAGSGTGCESGDITGSYAKGTPLSA